MKRINYTGSSKLIARIVAILNEKVPLPLDGQGDAEWGTSGQVLTTDGQGNTSWTTPQGGSSGHVIQDNGTDMTARAKLNFVGATVTDDAVNDATVVEFNGKTYTMTISGHTITLTDSDGTAQTVTVPDNDTTYTLSISGTTLTLTDSDGNHDDVTLPDNNTTYTISVSGTTVTLTGSDGSVQTITTQDTTYSDATQSTSGLMSASDKTKLDGIASSAEVNRNIWNRIKTALTKRSNLWFADASVSDASADDATKVEVVTELASENAFDALATDGTADGVYCFPDGGEEYLTADNVGYGSGTVRSGLDALYQHNYYYYNDVQGMTHTITAPTGCVATIVIKHSGGANMWQGMWLDAELIKLAEGGNAGTFTVSHPDRYTLTITSAIRYYRLGIMANLPLTITRS